MGVESRVRVAGRVFGARELHAVAEIVAQGKELSRTQLTYRACERLDWRRPTGAWKARECRDLLERLEGEGWFELPAKRANGRPAGARTQIPLTLLGEAGEPLMGSVGEFGTLSVEVIEERSMHAWWRELVGRYHYLSYRVPFGAHLRYLAYVSEPQRAVVAALQVSSPAWRLAPRDRWIGWDPATRERNLQRVVNHSRFVILPWVRVRNLASHLLSVLLRRLPADWQARYGVAPLLIETLVDGSRFRGSCYRAANWLEVGTTTGRGRMDRAHARHGHAPKRILVYPLVPDAARRLREG
jgi:ribosomal protein L37AE/L43A